LLQTLFIGLAAALFFSAAAKSLKLFTRDGKLVKIISFAELLLSLTACLIFIVAYPPTTAALTQYLYAFGGKITFLFPVAYVLPIVIVAIVVWDLVRQIKTKFFAKLQFDFTILACVAAFLLATGTYALPVMVMDSAAISFGAQGFRSLYDETSARVALLIMLGTVLFFAALIADIAAKITDSIGEEKLNKVALWSKLGVCAVFSIMFIYCFPAVIDHLRFCNEIAETSMDVPVNVGAGVYFMVVTPVLVLAAFVWGGFQTWQEIRQVTPERKESTSNLFGWLFRLFAALYAALMVMLFLCLAFPYGKQVNGGTTNSFYILNYKGYSGFELVEGTVPATISLYILVMVLFALVLAELVNSTVFAKKSAAKKQITVLNYFIIKGLITIVITGLFIGVYPGIEEYAHALYHAAGTTGIATRATAVPIILQVATIGCIVVVFLDLFANIVTHFRENNAKKK
jgi:hypothetical protein